MDFHLHLVSVIMPCLNSAETLAEAIKSVLLQDHKNIELIIIDDGSIDSSLSVVKEFQSRDKRVILIENTASHGVSFARNIGINSANGKYICFLDSDDYLLPGSISSRLSTAFEKNAKIVFGPYLRLQSNSQFSLRSVPQHVTFEDMLKRNYIGNLTGMYDADALGKAFQQPIKHEDYLMWCLLLKIVGVAYSTGSEPIAVYRVSPNSLSGNKIKSFIWHWGILRRGLDINIYLSTYYQMYYFFASLFDRMRFFLFR